MTSQPHSRPSGPALVKVLEKAVRILELVERGEGGEVLAADSLLGKLLEKNGLHRGHVVHYRSSLSVKKCAPRRRAPRPQARPNFVFIQQVFGGYGSPFGFTTNAGPGPTNTSTASGTWPSWWPRVD